MENKPYKRISVSRPKDNSLEAYKSWMREIAERLTTEKTGIKWTEEEWIAHWKKFWQEKHSS
jgi:sulfur relay (sulfurtransferase) DsrC/TusE family protein